SDDSLYVKWTELREQLIKDFDAFTLASIDDEVGKHKYLFKGQLGDLSHHLSKEQTTTPDSKFRTASWQFLGKYVNNTAYGIFGTPNLSGTYAVVIAPYNKFKRKVVR